MNNQEKQTYAKQELTSALIRLLGEKDIHKITVSELAKEAMVSRVSFYRNFKNMEDILNQQAKKLLHDWYYPNQLSFEEDNKTNNNRNDLLLSSLFGHLAEHSTFYLVLHQQKLFHYIIPILKKLIISKRGDSNFESYLAAFYLYGIYGWIVEWMEHDMEESKEEVEAWLRARDIG